MPLYHCYECVHEWEGLDDDKCDWCGSKGYMLEDETSFERFCKEIVKDETRQKILKNLARSGRRNEV